MLKLRPKSFKKGRRWQWHCQVLQMPFFSMTVRHLKRQCRARSLSAYNNQHSYQYASVLQFWSDEEWGDHIHTCQPKNSDFNWIHNRQHRASQSRWSMNLSFARSSQKSYLQSHVISICVFPISAEKILLNQYQCSMLFSNLSQETTHKNE